jgi:hypothetical protein
MPATAAIATGSSLSEMGWLGKVGTVVPHRWKDRISQTRAASSVALLCAVAIRPDGSLDFDHMKANVEGHRVVVDTELSYVVRRPCLVVPRTANRKQKRRINAGVVDRKFLENVGPRRRESCDRALSAFGHRDGRSPRNGGASGVARDQRALRSHFGNGFDFDKDSSFHEAASFKRFQNAKGGVAIATTAS